MPPARDPQPHSSPSTSLSRDRSTSSLQTVHLSPPRTQEPAHSTTKSVFSFSSLSDVWSSLKAAATVEIAGLLRGLSEDGGGAEGRRQTGNDGARAGDKREREGGGVQGRQSRNGERRSKRRRVQPGDDLLFDGGASDGSSWAFSEGEVESSHFCARAVPPLMPPISQAGPLPSSHSYDSLVSSPESRRNPSTSPFSSRHPARPSEDSTYADQLLHAATTDEGLSSSLAPRQSHDTSSRSGDGSGLRPLSGKRRVDPAGPRASASTSAASSTSALAARGLHRRGESHSLAAAGRHPAPLQNHVHFATLPSSTSMPNLASSSGASSPKTPGKGKGKARDREREREEVGTILLGEAAHQVERMWRNEKEKDRSRRRIEELEEEVQRLKGQVSPSLPSLASQCHADTHIDDSCRRRSRRARPLPGCHASLPRHLLLRRHHLLPHPSASPTLSSLPHAPLSGRPPSGPSAATRPSAAAAALAWAST